MHRLLLISGLIAAFCAGRVPAEETFEVPVELELPDLPVVLDLDDASVEVVLDPDSAPVLRALGVSDADAGRGALGIESDGGAFVVRRAGGGTEPGPRLRLELALGPERWLEVFGSDLEVVIEALPIEESGQDGAGGEEEDGAVEEEDDQDENGEAEDDGRGEVSGGARGDEAGLASPGHAASEIRHVLELASSSVHLIGVEGAQVEAADTYIHARGTRGTLNLALEDGTAEIEGHQGELGLTAAASELTLRDVAGVITPTLSGGSLLVQSGGGQIEGRFDGALLRLSDWRGPVTVEGRGATLQARGLTGVRLQIKGEGHQVAVDDLHGFLFMEVGGGSLVASKLKGQSNITARDGAEIAIDGIEGRPALVLEGSSARLAGVDGLLTAVVNGGRLEVDGVKQLSVTATGAEVVGRGIQRLAQIQATDSRLDFDLWEIENNPKLMLKGSTEARVRLRLPCSVKLGEVELLTGGVDVTGCELHSQTLRRTRYDRRGVDGNRRVVLSATLDEDSAIEIEGVP